MNAPPWDPLDIRATLKQCPGFSGWVPGMCPPWSPSTPQDHAPVAHNATRFTTHPLVASFPHLPGLPSPLSYPCFLKSSTSVALKSFYQCLLLGEPKPRHPLTFIPFIKICSLPLFNRFNFPLNCSFSNDTSLEWLLQWNICVWYKASPSFTKSFRDSKELSQFSGRLEFVVIRCLFWYLDHRLSPGNIFSDRLYE